MNTVKKLQTALSVGLLALVCCVMLSACAPTHYVHVGRNWETLHSLDASGAPFKVRARGQSSVMIGEHMRFSVTSEKSGRLWIVQVDPHDRTTCSFPTPVRVELIDAAAP